MAGIKITKRIVDAAEPRDKRYTIFDSDLRGFGLRVFPSGQKSWVLEYRPEGGGRRAAKRRLTIGTVGDLTPDEARSFAKRKRAEAVKGEDPQAIKNANRAALTVKEISIRFLTDHMEAKRKLSTTSHYRDIIDRLIIPAIGNRRAKDVTRGDVAKLHLELRQTPYQANRMIAVLGSIYSFASKTASSKRVSARPAISKNTKSNRASGIYRRMSWSV